MDGLAEDSDTFVSRNSAATAMSLRSATVTAALR
jgi:hypothetical protein